LGANDAARDYVSSSFSALEVYAALAVREVWRYREGRLEVWVLRDGEYRSMAESEVCAGLSVAAISERVARLGSEPMSRIRREFVGWMGDRLG